MKPADDHPLALDRVSQEILGTPAECPGFRSCSGDIESICAIGAFRSLPPGRAARTWSRVRASCASLLVSAPARRSPFGARPDPGPGWGQIATRIL